MSSADEEDRKVKALMKTINKLKHKKSKHCKEVKTQIFDTISYLVSYAKIATDPLTEQYIQKNQEKEDKKQMKLKSKRATDKTAKNISVREWYLKNAQWNPNWKECKKNLMELWKPNNSANISKSDFERLVSRNQSAFDIAGRLVKVSMRCLGTERIVIGFQVNPEKRTYGGWVEVIYYDENPQCKKKSDNPNGPMISKWRGRMIHKDENREKNIVTDMEEARDFYDKFLNCPHDTENNVEEGIQICLDLDIEDRRRTDESP